MKILYFMLSIFLYSLSYGVETEDVKVDEYSIVNDYEVSMYDFDGNYSSLKNEIKKGETIREEDLIMLRPELPDSFPPYKANDVIGKKVKRNIEKNNYIKITDI